jgi:hypothetical protein
MESCVNTRLTQIKGAGTSLIDKPKVMESDIRVLDGALTSLDLQMF